MSIQTDQTVVVAGGTGNVGGFIVRGFLERGATVAVPSRSEEKIRDLTEYLRHHLEGSPLDRLHTFVGDVSDDTGGLDVLNQITRAAGAPDAVVATLGSWRSASPLLEGSVSDLDYVLQHYLKAHFAVARTFLPGLSSRGGTYVFVNGPLAFEVWPGSGLVSIATAAQHMLFEALAKEYEDSPARVVELVSHAYIRNRQAQPGSPIPGEAVGAFAAHLASGHPTGVHGQSIHLRSLEQLEGAGLDVESNGVLAGETEDDKAA